MAKTYKAIYAGRRGDFRDGKVRQVFLRSDTKEEMFFTGIKRVAIGYTYECEAKSIKVAPKRTDDERIDNPEWDAADALVDAKNAEKRAAAKCSKESSPALQAAIDALVPLLKNTNFFDQRLLVEYLASEAGKKARAKK